MKGTGKKQAWVVEVRSSSQEFGGWVPVSTCADRETAFAVADALHNLSGCKVIARAVPCPHASQGKGVYGRWP